MSSANKDPPEEQPGKSLLEVSSPTEIEPKDSEESSEQFTPIYEPNEGVPEKRTGSFRQLLSSGSSMVKDTLNALPQFLSLTELSQTLSHASPEDRNSSKRYRREKPENAPINDSDDDDDAVVFSSDPKLETVTLQQLGGVSFEGREIKDDKTMNPGYIVVIPTHICFLRAIKNKDSQYTLIGRYPLNTITRIACKRQVPELLSFTIGFEENGKITTTATHQFIMRQAGECAKAVKDGVIALMMKSDPLAM
ncbi:unnamed protein product [Auanema sp. JU1783]|nr:unnamed protein product [Auanema sp. JU1783]